MWSSMAMQHLLSLLLIPLCWALCPTDTSCEERFNKCYKYVDEERDFFDAEDFCSQLGGHLVSISNVFEGALVLETAQSMFSGSSDYWIGANHLLTNSWSWTDGSQWSYTNWFPGEPATYDPVSAQLGSGLWSQSLMGSHKPFVCELPYVTENFTIPATCPSFPEPTPCPVCATTTACPRVTCPTTPPPTPAPRKPFCEDGWVHFEATKSCYKIIYNENFPAAEKMCMSLGAHLASVHSKAENDFIADIAKCGMTVVNWFSQTWLGLYKISGIWYWTDSTPVDYTHWAVGEPNNHFIDGSHTENCMQLYSDPMTSDDAYANENSYVWMWNDLPCDQVVRTAMCKKPQM